MEVGHSTTHMTPTHRILIADDEPAIRMLLAQLISAHGYEVKTAANGEEALRLAMFQDFDLALIDLLMPRKDGIETILEMRSRWPATRIIAMSGGIEGGGRNYLPLACKLGASRTLSKPFGGQEVLAAIAEECGQPEAAPPSQEGHLTW